MKADFPVSTTTATELLRVDGIAKRFGEFSALSGIDLTVRKGEFLCLLGPSGCGKTTLLRIIAGLEVPTAGSLQLNQRDVTRLPPSERDYGIVFQSYALFPNLNVADNIAYGLKGRREDKLRRVNELLDLIGLAGIDAKFPAQLSGGQQQRVALARALATSPGLLLLDEPLSALDARVREHLRREIKALQQKLGVTTIMVTHDQEEALTMADRIVVMNHGVIEQVGTPEEIYAQPASRFVADFVGQSNWIDATFSAEAGVQVNQLGIALQTLPALAVGQRELSLFIRPEDIELHAHWEGGAMGEANTALGDIEKIELLGGFYRLGINVPLWGNLRLNVDVSRSTYQRMRLSPERRVPLTLPADKLRAFSKADAAFGAKALA
ncbi:iron(III) transport system ATP-binding protein [Andreprevotia lacus DSM 23236]|jgi:iron(III) transport system ATP-binding protein|uniref:Iron(III) transport system ATP-binding protein n=1 Tax=Andreprevotia lacus DSM 23236 TaxID=1121001 RepID=A0A1W1XPR1_9NEIS|nr:putative 2-aminoethylphosphonate ABC transporter ATP-binding protein [Andreprevotia lacus]SMC25867.1 iron(III) transport system ATP-binding protein [Andreprevotia lacus DSM 23236]